MPNDPRQRALRAEPSSKVDSRLLRYLPIPQRLVEHGEMAPDFQPAVAGHKTAKWPHVVEDVQPFEPVRLEDPLTLELVSRARERAMADARSKKLLAGKRVAFLGATWQEGKSRDASSVRVLFYNYDQDLAVSVETDSTARRVLGVAELVESPAVSDHELQEAVRIALGDEAMAKARREGLVPNTILVDARPDEPELGRRLVEVRMSKPGSRLASRVVLVDLTHGRIATAHGIDSSQGCC